MTDTNVHLGTEVGCGGRHPCICFVFWGLCRVLKKLSLAGVLVQEHMNLPEVARKAVCERTHCTFPWGGGGSLTSSAGSVNPRKGNCTAPLGSQVSDILLSISGALVFLWAPFSSPRPPDQPWFPQGPPLCPPIRPRAHPARSGNASSPHPSPGRPCCSRSACGGWAQLCLGSRRPRPNPQPRPHSGTNQHSPPPAGST